MALYVYVTGRAELVAWLRRFCCGVASQPDEQSPDRLVQTGPKIQNRSRREGHMTECPPDQRLSA